MTDNSVTVIANLYFKSEKIDDGKQILMDLVEPSLAEQGCLFYQLYQDVTAQNHFTMIERWENQAALDSHAESEHNSRAKELVVACLDRDVELTTLKRC